MTMRYTLCFYTLIIMWCLRCHKEKYWWEKSKKKKDHTLLRCHKRCHKEVGEEVQLLSKCSNLLEVGFLRQVHHNSVAAHIVPAIFPRYSRDIPSIAGMSPYRIDLKSTSRLADSLLYPISNLQSFLLPCENHIYFLFVLVCSYLQSPISNLLLRSNSKYLRFKI